MRNDTWYVITYSDNFSPYYTPITRLIFWIKEIMKKINFSGGEPFLIKNGSNLGLWIIENISIIRTLFGWDGDILQGGPWHRVSQLSAMEVRSRRSGWRSLDTIWTSWPSLLTHLILTWQEWSQIRNQIQSSGESDKSQEQVLHLQCPVQVGQQVRLHGDYNQQYQVFDVKICVSSPSF